MAQGNDDWYLMEQETKSPAAWLCAVCRYEAQKRRDWSTFGQYLKNHRPPIAISKCTSAHVVEFMQYLNQFGKTRVHVPACKHYGTGEGNQLHV